MKKRGEQGPTSTDPAICGQCGKDKTARDAGMFMPCWNCVERDPVTHKVTKHLSPTGCPDCFKIPMAQATCARCGVYISRLAYWLNGERLPDHERDKYPMGWQVGYWAVWDARTPGELPYVREYLREPNNLRMVNKARDALGYEPLVAEPPRDLEDRELRAMVTRISTKLEMR